MTKLLVIGGSGFFGKSILDFYLSGALGRYGIDRMAIVARNASDLRQGAVVQRAERLELLDSDVRALKSLMGSDIVIHAASSSNAQRYSDDPAGERSVIIDGTARVLKLAEQSDQPVRIVYVSSGAVYGPQPANVSKLDEDAPFTNEPNAARRAYAEAKRSAEFCVRSIASSKAVQCAIARGFAFVGPNLPLDQHFAIGNFLRDALRGGPITVKSTNRVVRSYMFADDLVDWLLKIAVSCSSECPVYNVGSDDPVCLRDLAGMIGEIAKVAVSFPELDSSADVDRYVPCTDRAYKDLGVTMRFPLRVSIVETLRRYKGPSYARSRRSPSIMSAP